MNSTIFLSVIIPTYHRNDLLAKCLDCLVPGAQNLSIDQYEVIVTDDGIKTTAKELIRQDYPWVKWVAGPRKGPAANRNNGAKCAQGEWLVFTDDDCLPDPQWLEAYGKEIVQQPDCWVFEGCTYADRPRRTLAETSPVNKTGGYLWSCNFAIKQSFFNELSGFDERFPYAAMEDIELQLRIQKLNQSILFAKLASVCHPWRLSQGWKELKRHQTSTLIYLSIHPEESKRINSLYYIRHGFYNFFRITLPMIVQLKGRGTYEALLNHLSSLQMAFIVLIQPFLKIEINE
jgi:GT2 family glycosyltransferase